MRIQLGFGILKIQKLWKTPILQLSYESAKHYFLTIAIYRQCKIEDVYLAVLLHYICDAVLLDGAQTINENNQVVLGVFNLGEEHQICL